MTLQNWEIDFPPQSTNVDVSIIICAFNKWEYTLNCLSAVCKSLMYNVCSAEVILVDDASDDRTKEIFSTIRGLRYLRNDINLGFLQSANTGAKKARGEFLLFLNNDTEPIGNWIDPLINRSKSSQKVGAVGSKLIYPDGRLQEAGGIIFNDATGWNYGKYADPKNPEYSYARKVDYCSGASLLIRRSYWEKYGGFDTQFIPAYYEDTDFCFQLRKHKLEVWFEPTSLVVHHEGISHGVDESSGLKAYQLANKSKFFEKWQELLLQQSLPDSSKVEFAARSRYQRRILVIDHQIPTPDQDSGSLRLFEILSSLVNLNQHVTFIPQNGLKRVGYAERLQDSGVEVIWGDFQKITNYLSQRRDSIDIIWISRPGPAKFFFDNLHSFLPNIPIVYDTVDLHFQRMKRQAVLKASEEIYIDSLNMELEELEIISRSAAAVVVSETEKKVINERSSTFVKVISNVHKFEIRKTSLSTKSGLLFVGGFNHEPNEDAVAWFIQEIFPIVLRVLPDCRLRIVGSNAPEWLMKLNHPNVDVLGWVENLEEIYLSSRVSIAPLRFGAGVKGKVGESLSMGTPIVLTEIAAEGMKLENGKNSLIANQPNEFAQAIIRLMTDDSLWIDISELGKVHIEENFGLQTLKTSLSSLLNTVKPLESKWL